MQGTAGTEADSLKRDLSRTGIIGSNTLCHPVPCCESWMVHVKVANPEYFRSQRMDAVRKSLYHRLSFTADAIFWEMHRRWTGTWIVRHIWVQFIRRLEIGMMTVKIPKP